MTSRDRVFARAAALDREALAELTRRGDLNAEERADLVRKGVLQRKTALSVDRDQIKRRAQRKVTTAQRRVDVATDERSTLVERITELTARLAGRRGSGLALLGLLAAVGLRFSLDRTTDVDPDVAMRGVTAVAVCWLAGVIAARQGAAGGTAARLGAGLLIAAGVGLAVAESLTPDVPLADAIGPMALSILAVLGGLASELANAAPLDAAAAWARLAVARRRRRRLDGQLDELRATVEAQQAEVDRLTALEAPADVHGSALEAQLLAVVRGDGR